MAPLRPGQAKTGAADSMIGTTGIPVAPPPGRYEIDTSRSTVTFRTRHLFGLAGVRGSFTIRAGTVEVVEPLAGSRVHMEIDSASFRSGNGRRDDTVRSERLLDAGRYPVITFRAEGVDGPVLTGTLTVRDVTVPVTLPIEQTAVTPEAFEARASTRIDRNQFGVTAYRGTAGRYLDLSVEVRCTRM